MATAAWRSAILRRIRVPVQAAFSPGQQRPPALNHRPRSCAAIRFMSSHDDHLDKQELVDRVLSVVKSYPGVDASKVTPDCHFQKDLGLDSLDVVEVVMALEEEFKLEIPDKEADKIDSCGIAIAYISSHPMAG